MPYIIINLFPNKSIVYQLFPVSYSAWNHHGYWISILQCIGRRKEQAFVEDLIWWTVPLIHWKHTSRSCVKRWSYFTEQISCVYAFTELTILYGRQVFNQQSKASVISKEELRTKAIWFFVRIFRGGSWGSVRLGTFFKLVNNKHSFKPNSSYPQHFHLAVFEALS